MLCFYSIWLAVNLYMILAGCQSHWLCCVAVHIWISFHYQCRLLKHIPSPACYTPCMSGVLFPTIAHSCLPSCFGGLVIQGVHGRFTASVLWALCVSFQSIQCGAQGLFTASSVVLRVWIVQCVFIVMDNKRNQAETAWVFCLVAHLSTRCFYCLHGTGNRLSK